MRRGRSDAATVQAAVVSGRTVIVTGASSGIGAAAADRLGADGWNVVCAARREERLREVVDGIREAGGEATYCVTDVTSPEAGRQLVAQAVKRYGSLDALVATAGCWLSAFSTSAEKTFSPVEILRSRILLIRSAIYFAF